jgi:hypothetical protein
VVFWIMRYVDTNVSEEHAIFLCRVAGNFGNHLPDYMES